MLIILQWLQSNEKDSIFDNYLARLNPGFIQHLSPLITLSVGAAVTNTLDSSVMERLAWLEIVFANIDPRVSRASPFALVVLVHDPFHPIGTVEG